MNTVHRPPQIQVRKDKCLSRAEFLSLLRTYNCFCQDNKNLQLTYSDNNGKAILEGVLDIAWGVHQLIRFQIDDEKSVPSPIAIQFTDTTLSKRGMTRWGEFDNLYNIAELEEETVPDGKEQGSVQQLIFESSTLKPKRNPEPESGNLIRTRSDASLVKMRVKDQAVTAAKKAQRHRYSINGHFYNYKTSIFTPTKGSITNVRINSTMTTQEVIALLLQKFKIENDPNDFALYVVHANEEKKRLKDTAFPLWERLLHGPSRKIVKIFLMDKDAEEISTDVAQYIKFELPLLKTFLQKLNEEEETVIGKIKLRYKVEKKSLIQLLHKRMMVRAETSV
ncbi:ras association domain-containing protein 6 [Hemiscyllium ocellatum]|uniref:ras association domain-containing protein 6 n=1 Tax=Hemiscyllium ocellatum TaxID=170820 RepID=UPI0029661A1D|nr:ras association domain-containing protein 6 [Hemiscyllium ocellatum]XP_060696827.1 ras association domain-containing protein 6 [Hemiscyllium ocellatum]XP_060696834.1 ras association domain-containing protein 6 [Hemiscyllium ocellatum]XP_060696844.1 ras association domain-containing protein 6 [Hemiscyllium ocellatum]XP_060696852.1 ras association domain-containing protein 6 [Hemiscyllium ocellatum]XP_060696858.1 ras association domain-containing protein 6 [Hemiscyllium ocellatum]